MKEKTMSKFNFIKPEDVEQHLFLDELVHSMNQDSISVSISDGISLIKVLKENNYGDLNLCFNLVKKINNELVSNNFGWLIYQRIIKICPPEQVFNQSKNVDSYLSITHQLDRSQNSDKLCVFSFVILKWIDKINQNQFKPQQTLDWISKLKVEFLSKSPQKFNEDEFASDYEKYYSLLTKATLKLGVYQECLKACNTILDDSISLHYNNELWFSMRKGLCLEMLGAYNESEEIFNQILSKKESATKWFLYKDLAEVLYDLADFEKAWIYAVDAAYIGGKSNMLINLYLLQAKLLYKLNRSEEGRIFAEMIAAIFQQESWKMKSEFVRLLSY